MRKKILLASLFTVASLALLHPYVYPNLNGAPAAHTGAPGEATCAISGCHSDNAVNTGDGVLAIKIMDGTTEVSEFSAGKTYNVEVSLSKAGANAFGFETTIKRTGGAGNLATGGNTDVKKIAGNYITHTNPDPHHSGMDMWTFQWIAPTTGTGDVTFYTAGNAANGNDMPTGDFIYKTSKAIRPAVTAMNEETLFRANMRTYPNPVENVLAVEFTSPAKNTNSSATLKIFSLDGKLLKTVESSVKAFSGNTIYADLSGYAKGIYLAKLQAGENIAVKKVIKN